MTTFNANIFTFLNPFIQLAPRACEGTLVALPTRIFVVQITTKIVYGDCLKPEPVNDASLAVEK